MVELFFEFIFEFVLHAAFYVPGACIAAMTGKPVKDFSENEAIGISLAFWGAFIVLGLIGWAAVSWLTAAA